MMNSSILTVVFAVTQCVVVVALQTSHLRGHYNAPSANPPIRPDLSYDDGIVIVPKIDDDDDLSTHNWGNWEPPAQDVVVAEGEQEEDDDEDLPYFPSSGGFQPSDGWHQHQKIAPGDYDWEDNWNEPPSVNDDLTRPWAPENPDEEWHSPPLSSYGDDDGYHDRNIIVNPDFRPTKDFRPYKPYPPLFIMSSADGKVVYPIHDDSFRYYDPEADPDAVVPPMPGNDDDDDGPDNGPDNEERAKQKNYDYGNWEPPAHDITLG